MVQLSVVVCTLNRSVELERALKSLLVQRCPTDAFEVVVVDNGSRDDSAQVVARAAAGSTRVHYVVERRLGLSLARNRGTEESQGRYVAFLDDDAEADPDWVAGLIELFKSNPDIGAAGGRTVVRWPDAPPPWICGQLEGYYGKCDYGDTQRDLMFPDYPFGSNMAFCRSLLVELNGFCADLGARGANLMAGEETDLFERLHTRKVRVLYDPTLLVHHWAARHRITRAWSLKRSFKHGLTSSTMRLVRGDRGWESWTGPLARAVRLSMVGAVSTVAALATRRDPATVMSRGATTVYWSGFARGALTNAIYRSGYSASAHGGPERRRAH